MKIVIVPAFHCLAGLALAAAFAGTAAAESPPMPCSRHVMFAPPSDVTIPAQTPGVLFRLPEGVYSRTIESFAIEMRGPDGAAISTTAAALDDGWYHVRPARPFVEGNHTFSFNDLCAWPVPAGRAELRFRVGPAVSWPASLGTARVGDAVGGWEGRCEGYAAWAPITLEPSAELRAHRGTTRFDVDWNGTRRRTEYGTAVQTMAGALQLPLEFRCSAAEPRITGTVTITARTAGAPGDPPPLTLSVDIPCPHLAEPKTCQADAGARPSPVDAGAADRAPASDVPALGPNDAGAPGVATDASPASHDAPAAPAPGKGGGCRVATAAPSGGVASLWVAAAALAAVSLRRRFRTGAGRRGSSRS